MTLIYLIFQKLAIFLLFCLSIAKKMFLKKYMYACYLNLYRNQSYSLLSIISFLIILSYFIFKKKKHQTVQLLNNLVVHFLFILKHLEYIETSNSSAIEQFSSKSFGCIVIVFISAILKIKSIVTM